MGMTATDSAENQHSADRPHAIIAGGGIGGLTAALCLTRTGWRVTVCEQAPALTAVGAGIQLSPNAMKVMRLLGLETAILAAGFQPESLMMRYGASGRTIFDVEIAGSDSLPPVAGAIKRWQAPYVHIHRAALIAVLKEALEERAPGSLRTGCTVTGYRFTPGGIEATCAEGSPVKGTLLIGADGLHSVIRAHLHSSSDLFSPNRHLARPLAGWRQKAEGAEASGQENTHTYSPPDILHPPGSAAHEAKRYTGNIAWRATVPADAVPEALRPPRAACVWTGPGRHAVTYYVRDPDDEEQLLINFVGIVERPQPPLQTDSWSATGVGARAQADFAGFCPVVRAVTDAAAQTDAGFGFWPLYDRTVAPFWSDISPSGNSAVLLLGDALHPMLPSFAQGAAMAMEDAAVLADSLYVCATGQPALSEAAPEKVPEITLQALEEALTLYIHRRRDRVTEIQRRSRRNLQLFHHRSALAQLAVYGPAFLAGRLAPSFLLRQFDDVYGFDPLKD